MYNNDKRIKIIFAIRIVLWIIALVATIYWIYWSFNIYELGFENEHEYARAFRPYFAKGLGISIGSLVVSTVLRSISDKIKKRF